MDRSTHTKNNAPTKRRPPWEAFVSMPLTSLVLVVAILLALLPLVSETGSAHAEAPATAPAVVDEVVPTAPVEPMPFEKVAPDEVEGELVSEARGLYVLQPVQVVSVHIVDAEQI